MLSFLCKNIITISAYLDNPWICFLFSVLIYNHLLFHSKYFLARKKENFCFLWLKGPVSKNFHFNVPRANARSQFCPISTTWCSLNILGSNKFHLIIPIIDFTLGKIDHNMQKMFIPRSLSEPPISLIPTPHSITCWPPSIVVTKPSWNC